MDVRHWMSDEQYHLYLTDPYFRQACDQMIPVVLRGIQATVEQATEELALRKIAFDRLGQAGENDE